MKLTYNIFRETKNNKYLSCCRDLTVKRNNDQTSKINYI